MSTAYRRVAALLLGSLILLTSLHYIANWKRCYDAYLAARSHRTAAAAPLASQSCASDAERRMALTHCAALLEGGDRPALACLLGEAGVAVDGLHIAIESAGMPLSAERVLDGEQQSPRYRLRYRGRLNYSIEVTYD